MRSRLLLFTSAARAAALRGSSPPPPLPPPPNVRPGLLLLATFGGNDERGADVWFDCAGAEPRTRPGVEKCSGSLEEREQMLPMIEDGARRAAVG